MVGRHPGQAPDIDGSVYLSGDVGAPGRIVRGRVSAASDYDLVAEIIEEADVITDSATRSLPAQPSEPAKPTRRRLKVV